MPGPEKDPVELKILRGTDRPEDREAAKAEEEVSFTKVTEATFPPAPQWLDADGRKMWNTVGKMLCRVGVLQDADLYALQQLCYRWQISVAKMKAGLPIPASDDSTLTQLFREFGMTPSARKRVARHLLGNAPGDAGAGKPTGNRFDKHAAKSAA